MLFVATCTDRPDSMALRLETRPAHLAYPASLGDRVRIGGAMLTSDQSSVVGSLLIFEAVDEAEVRALLADDPYAKAQLFASVDVKPWRQAVGLPLA
ncbi:MAG: YciI family protein [Hyphomicrobiales bacterium]|nr:YciI family protein [Hyphomicrobiales bacterium]